jgi:hypothetical protein
LDCTGTIDTCCSCDLFHYSARICFYHSLLFCLGIAVAGLGFDLIHLVDHDLLFDLLLNFNGKIDFWFGWDLEYSSAQTFLYHLLFVCLLIAGACLSFDWIHLLGQVCSWICIGLHWDNWFKLWLWFVSIFFSNLSLPFVAFLFRDSWCWLGLWIDSSLRSGFVVFTCIWILLGQLIYYCGCDLFHSFVQIFLWHFWFVCLGIAGACLGFDFIHLLGHNL